MVISGFVVPWESINQAIVSISTYRRKNPSWTLTVFYDDVLTRQRLENAFTDLEYIQLNDANSVSALDHALNQTDQSVMVLFNVTTLCNRPLLDIANVDLKDQAVVMRPDRPFELTTWGKAYPKYDPRYLDRYMRSRSYFSMGTVVFNLTVLRDVLNCETLLSHYMSGDCLDRGMPKHYLNRVMGDLKKGLLLGRMLVKPEEVMCEIFSSSQCMRHQVRMLHATITDFSSKKAPWLPIDKIDRLFIQIPYRMYYNRAMMVSEHLDDAFVTQIRANVKRQLDRYGDLDKIFEKAYDVAVL